MPARVRTADLLLLAALAATVLVLAPGSSGAALAGPLVVLCVVRFALRGPRAHVVLAATTGAAALALSAFDERAAAPDRVGAAAWSATALVVGLLVDGLVARLRAHADAHADAPLAGAAPPAPGDRPAPPSDPLAGRGAFAGAPVGVAVAGIDGRLLAVNAALAELTGRDEAALLATRVRALAHPGDGAALRERLRALITGLEETVVLELRLLHAAGHVVPVAVHAALLRDPDGRPEDVLLQVEEITGRRGAEERPAAADAALHAAERGGRDGVALAGAERVWGGAPGAGCCS